MYVKIFAQIYDSSIAEDYLVRLVFEDFLILADKDGHVDMTAAAIARRTNVPLEVVNRAIEKLSSPDPESRSPNEDGRRIVLLDPHRSWGWRIVNYPQYRNIRDDESRKEYFRDRKREQRAKSKGVLDSQGQLKTFQECPAMSPRQKQEAEAEAEIQKKLGELSLSSPEPATIRIKPSDFPEIWNRNCGRLPKVAEFSDSRRKKALTRIRQGITLETFETAVKACTEKPFLRGENARAWTATFDWLIKNDLNIERAITEPFGLSQNGVQRRSSAWEEFKREECA